MFYSYVVYYLDFDFLIMKKITYSDFFVSYSSSIVLSFCLLQINLSALKIRIFMVFPKAKLPTFHVELTHTRKPTRFLGLSILLVVAWIYPVILLQTKGLPAFCITRPRVKWIMERCFVQLATQWDDKLCLASIMLSLQVIVIQFLVLFYKYEWQYFYQI